MLSLCLFNMVMIIIKINLKWNNLNKNLFPHQLQIWRLDQFKLIKQTKKSLIDNFYFEINFKSKDSSKDYFPIIDLTIQSFQLLGVQQCKVLLGLCLLYLWLINYLLFKKLSNIHFTENMILMMFRNSLSVFYLLQLSLCQQLIHISVSMEYQVNV